MLVSIQWLKRYVRVPDDIDRLVEDLTMTGLHVERRIEQGINDPAIVVGRVVGVNAHPNADRLTLCSVDVGGPERDIVCGAPNVAAGQYVVVALPGAKLPDGTKIRSSKIRGVVSDGMICSERELGIGEDASGIIVLEGDRKVGTPIGEVFMPPDCVLEIEVTPNRPDLLSHVGVAREIAAIYDLPLEHPCEPAGVPDAPMAKAFSVTIEDPEDCARYVGKLVTGVTVGPSPAWLVSALDAVGIRSKNNIVDITNFVLWETGQPIHAFDFRTLRGGQILVRRARPGEKLEALDGMTHELTPDMLVIADEKRAVALAGVIGGEETAVHGETTEVLVESANFDTRVVRRTRCTLGISTDASYRFERGADPDMCRAAAERAAALMIELAGGKAGDVADVYAQRQPPRRLTVRQPAARKILGAHVSTGEIARILGRLCFGVASRDNSEAVDVEVPSFRADVAEEIDLIEEVARYYGYQRIGKAWTFRTTTFTQPNPFDTFVDSLANHLAARGFTEIVGSSFTDGREVEDFGWRPDDPRGRLIRVRNPLSSQHGYLRTSLLPGMLDVVRRNLDHGTRHLMLYQTGTTFLPVSGTDQLPEERLELCLALTWPDEPDFWYNARKSVDLFAIKSEIELILSRVAVNPAQRLAFEFEPSGGSFGYRRRGETIVEGGVLSEAIARRYDFDQPVWHATIDVQKLYGLRPTRATMEPLATYPATKRDLSLVAREGIAYGRIEKQLVKSAGRLLESYQLFDVYRGDKLAPGRIAYGLRLSFRSPERTLTDGEIDDIVDRVLTKLKTELGVELRS